jgi:hypothetical protein
MNLTLTRFGSTPFGTFGNLEVGGKVFYTVERPWLDNEKGKSCVPLGHYSLVWQPTTTPVPASYEGGTWYLNGGTVTAGHTGAHRTRIAIHIGNVSEDVQGCIALGRALGYVRDRWAVTASRSALEGLLQGIGKGNHTLDIVGSDCG